LDGSREEAYSCEFGGAATDPVPHRQEVEPVVFLGDLVQFAAFASDGDGVFGKAEAGDPIGGLGFEHTVACFGRTARLGDDHGECFTELTVECVECAIESIRVGVVEKEQFDLICLRATERVCDKLRAECRAADANHEEVLEGAVGTL